MYKAQTKVQPLCLQAKMQSTMEGSVCYLPIIGNSVDFAAWVAAFAEN